MPGHAANEIRTSDRGPTEPAIRFPVPPPPVLTPAEAVAALRLPPGFHAEVVAAEPLIEAPIAMSWDAAGHAYVVEMCGYMNDISGTGEDLPNCRVKRLEDTDGDGVYDKAVIFVDHLVLPRAVLAFGDGALIAEPPNLTWYHDRDGDGVAESSELVAGDFGIRGGQPEHMCNSPLYTLDNWIWCAGHHSRYRLQNGKWITQAMPSRGQWGLSQDDWGRLYYDSNSDILRADLFSPSYAIRNPHLTQGIAINFQVMKDQSVWPSHPTPGINRGYAPEQLRADGTQKSATATCGPSIYRGDLFPLEYLGNAFVPEPAGNLVKRVIVDDIDGMLSGRNAYHEREFLTSTDERFRPVNTYTGPDGALYVVDMARGIIQHRFFETYYLIANIQERKLETPLNLGRIYRIVPDGAKPKQVRMPEKTAELVPYLSHRNGWVRDTAQRLLVERQDLSCMPALERAATLAPLAQGRVQALWTLEGLGALRDGLLASLFTDGAAPVRATALRLASPQLVEEMTGLAMDSAFEVRLQAALSLSAIPGPASTRALIGILQRVPVNPLLAEAITTGLKGRELEFLEAVLLAKFKDQTLLDSRILPLLAGCVMVERSPEKIERLLDLAASLPPESARLLALLEGIAKVKAKPVPLPDLPPALAKLFASEGHPKTKALEKEVLAKLVWPGKPETGQSAPPAPLNSEQRALFEKGKALYGTVCAACHQPTGIGQAGLAPPLAGSEWVLGPADRSIRILLHGLSGPVTVAGTPWQLEMPPLGAAMNDEQIAAVLTYLRREWGHTASPVAPADVARMRERFPDRGNAWTAEELMKSLPSPK